MDLKNLSHQDLVDYCAKHEIFFPATAPREALEAAVYLTASHGEVIKPDAQIGCFGHHDRDDGNCRICRYNDECETSTLGVPRERYDRALSMATNKAKASARGHFLPVAHKNIHSKRRIKAKKIKN